MHSAGALPKEIDDTLICVVAALAEGKWQKLAVFLRRKISAIQQYKEQFDDNLLRARMAIEDWVTEWGREATVNDLIRACENCGIHKDHVEAKYKANVS